MRRGVSPALLLEQTRNTASWAIEGERPITSSARSRLLGAVELEEFWRGPEAQLDYLGLMLAAHYVTVATFVPTDVDAHIRYHIWQEIETEDALERALEVVEEAAAWPVHEVSERVVELPGFRSSVDLPPRVYGHAGEWFSVRAGALGRALAIGADATADRLVAKIDAELIHEAEAFAFARQTDPLLALRVATTLAHNTGDLGRVVEAWPKGNRRKVEFLTRYTRLGHGSPNGAWLGDHKRELELAGHVNKEVMAPENHRYLALREPRSLRRHRALILPLGPFFERWARQVIDAAFEPRELGEILGALIYGTESTPGSSSYFRAIAELHRIHPGTIDAIAEELPARYRKLVQRGPVRDALRVEQEQWDARLIKAWAVAQASFG
jgi:hypothetical protein